MTQGERGPDGATGPNAANPPMAPATAGWLVALLGWTVLLCFYDLDGGPRFEPIDCWVAQTAREMQDAGDWLVPRFAKTLYDQAQVADVLA